MRHGATILGLVSSSTTLLTWNKGLEKFIIGDISFEMNDVTSAITSKEPSDGCYDGTEVGPLMVDELHDGTKEANGIKDDWKPY